MSYRNLNLLLSLLMGLLCARDTASQSIDINTFERNKSPGTNQGIILSAQNGVLDGSKKASNHVGYTGDEFIDFGGVGTSASWLVDIPLTGSYIVTLRYASKNDRGPLDLFIDSKFVGAFKIEKVANNWNTWKDETLNVHIDAGSNRVLKIEASTIQGPNVDKLEIKMLRPIENVYKVLLREKQCLDQGVFRESASRQFEVGLDQSGLFVVRRRATSEVVWSSEVSRDNKISKICLETNGDLVIQPSSDNEQICAIGSKGIYERSFGFHFGINDFGGIAVFLDSNHLLWTGGLNSQLSVEPTAMANHFRFPTPTPTFPSTSRGTTQVPSLSNQSNKDYEYKVALSQNNYFRRGERNYHQSHSGEFEVGLNEDGNLVVRRSETISDVLWVLKDANDINVTCDRLYMQNDGNLVMRAENRKVVWTSKTADSRARATYYFGINNCGGLAVFHSSNPSVLIWTGGNQDRCGITAPQEIPTLAPAPLPALSNILSPKPTLDSSRPTSKPYSVILASNNRLLDRDQFISSPNGQYNIGLNSKGQLIMRRGDDSDQVWTLRDKNGKIISNISRMYMQNDGNMVLKTSSNKSLWNSETSKNPGAEFRIDNDGQLSINFEGTSLWIDGLPREIYTGPSSLDLKFPVRGFFYYAWYPETWTIGGKPVKYKPNLNGIGEGQYRSGEPIVVKNHVKALDYAFADISIVSWWGPSDRLDRARITNLLDETTTQGSGIKWTVYYEDEKRIDRNVPEILADLDYLKKWFAWHESWAHKDGKPVIFVWNESECEVADRWVEAARNGGWYVVLKLFGKYDECKSQPDSWHQYGVSDNYLEYPSSFTIGPGFYKANADKPDHPRVPRKQFCKWVDEMNRSNRDWQLIVSFNEWGEGTAVESAVEWESKSGYGIYLDCLHDPVLFGAETTTSMLRKESQPSKAGTGSVV